MTLSPGPQTGLLVAGMIFPRSIFAFTFANSARS